MATAGYSGTPLPKKLGIKEGSLLATVHAPEGFEATLGALPPEAEWRTRLAPGLDVVVAFYTSRATLAKEWPKLTEAVAPNGTVWVAWPKKASKMADRHHRGRLARTAAAQRLGRQQGVRDRRHVERPPIRAASRVEVVVSLRCGNATGVR